MACTTILVGKKASYDGSTMIARTEDSQSGVFTPKEFLVVTPEDQPRHYQSVLSNFSIDLPDNPMRYTAMPNAKAGKGIWAASGVNAANVAMTATETITSNPRVLGADPLVEKGIGEEDLVYIVLPYIHTAKEEGHPPDGPGRHWRRPQPRGPLVRCAGNGQAHGCQGGLSPLHHRRP